MIYKLNHEIKILQILDLTGILIYYIKTKKQQEKRTTKQTIYNNNNNSVPGQKALANREIMSI